MKYKPLVTIVIPVYNGKNYLREAIDAALSQTYSNIEVIVVNDGSNDDGATESIALDYGDRIRYFRKENGGVSSALNLAIANMQGDWFSWLSHDDLYLPEKINAQVDYINTLLHDNPKLDLKHCVIYCKNYTIDANGRIIKKKIFNLPKYCDKKTMVLKHIKNYRIGGCAVLVPRNAFSEVGLFDENCRTASDKEYWFRLIEHNYSFYFLNKRLVKNRVHKKQVGKVYAEKMKTEGDKLNTDIINSVWDNRTDEDWVYFSKLGFYLVKRGYHNAANVAFNYAMELSGDSPGFHIYRYLGTTIFSLKGRLFFTARTIWRRFMVK